MVNTAISRKRITLDPVPENGKRSRIYVLLSITPGNIEYAAELFRTLPLVTTVDVLEGDPNLLLMIEAKNRLQLAERLMEALSAPGDVIENVDILITGE